MGERTAAKVASSAMEQQSDAARPIQMVAVDRIRPEPGLGRKRDRSGHDELCQSIQQFGVLTPITVRPAPDGSGDLLLVKGQGRTLACRRIGLSTVPAIVVDDGFTDVEKVQQFLVENVARLRMKPVDRALLIANARADGEETADVARRFGVSATTVRRLQLQLAGASSAEIRALRSGDVNLAVHAAVARHATGNERAAVLRLLAGKRITAANLDSLFAAIGWNRLQQLGPKFARARLALLAWCLSTFSGGPRAPLAELIERLATDLPKSFADLDEVSA